MFCDAEGRTVCGAYSASDGPLFLAVSKTDCQLPTTPLFFARLPKVTRVSGRPTICRRTTRAGLMSCPERPPVGGSRLMSVGCIFSPVRGEYRLCRFARDSRCARFRRFLERVSEHGRVQRFRTLLTKLPRVSGPEAFLQRVAAITETSRDVMMFADVVVSVVRRHYLPTPPNGLRKAGLSVRNSSGSGAGSSTFGSIQSR